MLRFYIWSYDQCQGGGGPGHLLSDLNSKKSFFLMLFYDHSLFELATSYWLITRSGQKLSIWNFCIFLAVWIIYFFPSFSLLLQFILWILTFSLPTEFSPFNFRISFFFCTSRTKTFPSLKTFRFPLFSLPQFFAIRHEKSCTWGTSPWWENTPPAVPSTV